MNTKLIKMWQSRIATISDLIIDLMTEREELKAKIKEEKHGKPVTTIQPPDNSQP